MGSFNWLSPASALGGLAPRLQSLRDRLRSRRPAVRWSLAVAALVAVVLLVYLGVTTPSRAETAYLNGGRRFAPEDLSKIGRALDRQRIAYHIDDERRVAVSSSKRDQAEELVSKLDLGPRLPGELRDQASAASPWESTRDKELREHQERARISERMINDLPGILGSFVSVNRPRARLGLQPTSKPSAFVRLETDGDRQLPFRTVQSITTILTSYEDGLTADAITVVDRRGHRYLVAGNPELSALSSNRAREEELSQEILEQLDWIKGVRVSVQLPAGGAESPAPTGVRTKEPEPPSAGPSRKPTGPALALNRAMSLEPEPAAEASSSTRSPDASGSSFAPAKDGKTSPRTPPEPGRIWVRVPRSYYYQASLLPGRKEPSRDDMLKLAARTEEQIRTGVGLIVGPTAWKTTIDIIQDELPPTDPSVVTEPSGRRPALDWGIAGALGAMAASLVALGSWALQARRPSGRGEPTPHGLRYDVGTASAPGPSERVREFVRRNPEAAVSVLERWTSQGGPHA